MRSVNDDQGMEFTWSVWIYINDISNYKPNEYKHVFHKGNDDVNLDESHPVRNEPAEQRAWTLHCSQHQRFGRGDELLRQNQR